MGFWGLLAGIVWAQAPERCDGEDNDGDGAIDEPPLAFGRDSDGDGFGSGLDVALALDCEGIEGRVPDTSDCDDTRAQSNPGSPEICDSFDNDCDGLIETGYECKCFARIDAGSVWQRCDGDLTDWYSAEQICFELEAELASIADSAEQIAAEELLLAFQTDFWIGGNDLSNEGLWSWSDGSPFLYEVWRDEQPDNGGYAYDDEDCMEMTATGEWNDRVCESALPYLCERDCEVSFYADLDGDGLGNPEQAVRDCSPPEGYVPNALDCDDTQQEEPAARYPDTDSDGYGDPERGLVACEAEGLVRTAEDCDDTAQAVHPGAGELAGDGIDSDCDGSDGEGPPGEETGETEEPETEPTVAGGEVKEGSDVPEPPYGFGCGCSDAALTARPFSLPLARRRP